MKNVSLIFNVILTIAVAFLFYLNFKKPIQVTTITTSSGKDSTIKVDIPETLPEGVPMGKILYVDIDTINEKYTFIKNQKAIIERQGAQAEASLKAKAQSLQSEFIEYQKKAQAGELTQQQAMAMEKSLTDKQQALAQQEQKLSTQLVEKTQKIQEELNAKMRKELKVFMEKYGADYILGYTEGANILLPNPKLNITKEVLNRLNESDKKK
ncbi:MAG TPA: OmpH family outer membrane protein [Saprospiraceae bacterium]|jgi:outer membrane protein|nr:MAG: outer membrane chaperone Skp [Candidatus Parvibacillus calidus]MCC7150075.1 OmpH family outer membrane protein [Saprospiraceae bacterium]WKZ63038.1 MAG: OmpH family outer membrane protein [Saprospiraceae bacterium]HQP76647.1 OmpH family outer membrane protein [Saprospiraceae bacterium]HRN34936.1 OmpH family outer membrane protein [Saprospiraceae bacterium]